jgi:hypothetical protein
MRRAARAKDISLDEYQRVVAIAQREAALALAIGRALRLTVQSRVQARTAGRRADGPRPTASIDVLFEGVHDE